MRVRRFLGFVVSIVFTYRLVFNRYRLTTRWIIELSVVVKNLFFSLIGFFCCSKYLSFEDPLENPPYESWKSGFFFRSHSDPFWASTLNLITRFRFQITMTIIWAAKMHFKRNIFISFRQESPSNTVCTFNFCGSHCEIFFFLVEHLNAFFVFVRPERYENILWKS